jgi:hypothetical protein
VIPLPMAVGRQDVARGAPAAAPIGTSYNEAMAEHRVTVHPSRPLEVLSADLVVEIYSDEQKLGELRLSRGSIDWVARSHHRPISKSWEAFAKLMSDNA